MQSAKTTPPLAQKEFPPVPVVDLQTTEQEASEIVKLACLTTGFFYVTNSIVTSELVAEQFASSRAFFQLPTEDKLTVKVNKYYRGYTPMYDDKLDPENRAIADTKEGLYIGREIALDSEENMLPLHGPNNWPKEDMVPGFRATMTKYHQACVDLTRRLVRLIAMALDLPATFFDEDFKRPIATLRPLHYAPSISAPDKGIFAAGAHTDYGMVTILATDDVPGLQILFENDWLDVPPKKDHLIINLGDMLHRMTNGRFLSNRHRVVTLAGQERFSTAFFGDPQFDACIAPLPTCYSGKNPPKWAPTTSGEYLMERYNATHVEYAKQQQA